MRAETKGRIPTKKARRKGAKIEEGVTSNKKSVKEGNEVRRGGHFQQKKREERK
jgi:hypothetical protein